MSPLRFLLLGLASLLLASCSGYRLGGNPPAELAQVKTLHVPTVKNDTVVPRAAPMLTNSIVDELTSDGTFLIADGNSADAVLNVRIVSIDYNPLRSSRTDSLRPEELELRLTAAYEVIDAATGKELTSGSVDNRTNIFLSDNLQLSRNNALPDVAHRVATELVTRLANGF